MFEEIFAFRVVLIIFNIYLSLRIFVLVMLCDFSYVSLILIYFQIGPHLWVSSTDIFRMYLSMVISIARNPPNISYFPLQLIQCPFVACLDYIHPSSVFFSVFISSLKLSKM